MTGIVNQVAALGTEAGGLENILFQYVEHILPSSLQLAFKRKRVIYC